MSAVITVIQWRIRSASKGSKAGKGNKGMKIRKDLFLFASDMIIYAEKPKDSAKHLPITSESSKVTRCKINI